MQGAVGGGVHAELVRALELLLSGAGIADGWTADSSARVKRLAALAMEEAAPPPRPISMAGPPSTWPELPPIGRPIPGAQARVLDPSLQPVPVSRPGS